MINVNEARKMAKKNDVSKSTLRAIVKQAMPVVDQHIRRVAEAGCYKAVVTREEIMENVETTFFTKREIVDAVAVEIKKYGYTVAVTSSSYSIHVEW